MPRYRRKSHLLKLEFTLEYKKSDLRKKKLWKYQPTNPPPPPPPPPGRCIYLTYRRFRLYLKTKRFPLRYTHLQRRLYRTRITQRRLRFLRLCRITRLLLLRLLLLLVLLLLRFRRRLRRRLRRCLLRFRRNRPRL